MAHCAEFSGALSRPCANNFAPLSLQWTKRMATIHDEIDNWLAADIHGELSADERSAPHAHIVDCAACRKAHQENKVMNKMLEETLAQEKPDPAFEQRMLAGFRNRIPQRSGFLKSIVDLMRLRAIQITAVAAVLLALVQVGRLITGEGAAVPPNREYAGGEGRGPQALTDEISAVRKSENGRDKETAARKLKSGFSTTAPQPAAAPAPSPAQMKGQRQESTQVERTIVTGSNISPAEGGEPNPAEASVPALANRKLVRNANVELEIVSFDNAVEKITEFANEERGYVATTSSEKQANGKLKGEIVVRFCRKILIISCKSFAGLAS